MFRAAKEGTQKVITGHRLGDGLVVFLAADGSWTLDIAEARTLADGSDLDEALDYAQAQHDARVVVEPYTIDVTTEDGALVPVRIRERIRAEGGPTVLYGQAERDARAQKA